MLLFCLSLRSSFRVLGHGFVCFGRCVSTRIFWVSSNFFFVVKVLLLAAFMFTAAHGCVRWYGCVCISGSNFVINPVPTFCFFFFVALRPRFYSLMKAARHIARSSIKNESTANNIAWKNLNEWKGKKNLSKKKLQVQKFLHPIEKGERGYSHARHVNF